MSTNLESNAIVDMSIVFNLVLILFTDRGRVIRANYLNHRLNLRELSLGAAESLLEVRGQLSLHSRGEE